MFRAISLNPLPTVACLALCAASAHATTEPNDDVASFCTPMLMETQGTLESGGVPALNALFETEAFRSQKQDEMSWTISVGSLNQDIFVDNVVFPELRGAPGYVSTVDANNEAFLVPVTLAFEDGADSAFTSAAWANATDGLTVWIGYALRNEANGDTYESICWVDTSSL